MCKTERMALHYPAENLMMIGKLEYQALEARVGHQVKDWEFQGDPVRNEVPAPIRGDDEIPENPAFEPDDGVDDYPDWAKQ